MFFLRHCRNVGLIYRGVRSEKVIIVIITIRYELRRVRLRVILWLNRGIDYVVVLQSTCPVQRRCIAHRWNGPRRHRYKQRKG